MSPSNMVSIDFESESLINTYKKEILRGAQRYAVRGMSPVECRIKGTRQLGFTKFDEGTEYDHFKVFIPESDVYVSIHKAQVVELDGRELAYLVSEKYKESDNGDETGLCLLSRGGGMDASK